MINIVLDAPVNNNDISLSNLQNSINGSIDEIQCLILDDLNHQDRMQTIELIFHKLKNNGTATLKFIDFFRIVKKYIEGKISSTHISKIINNIKSVADRSDVDTLISNHKHIRLDKIMYDNDYMIVVFNKNI